MSIRTGLLILVAGIGVVAAAQNRRADPPPTAADVKDALTAADRAFAKASAEKGLDGWMSFMADDAVRVTPMGGKATVGKAAVKELDVKLFADPKKKLVWEPTDGGPFADPAYGWTTGKAKIVGPNDKGMSESIWTGSYVTVWHKGADGTWKVILDTGASDPPKQ
jgi:ketosteroid isomerase-like protein